MNNNNIFVNSFFIQPSLFITDLDNRGGVQLRASDKVRICLDKEDLKKLQSTSPGGWNDEMSEVPVILKYKSKLSFRD